MQINIGDKVRFLNDVGGGIVTRIIDSKTVMVVNEEDEFEIPALKSNLVVIESTDKTVVQNKKSAEQKNNVSASAKSNQSLNATKEEVYAAFVPREHLHPTKGPFELYLINDTNQILLYNFCDENEKGFRGITAGNLDPKSKIQVSEYDSKEIGDLKSCHFQIVFYQLGKTVLKKPLDKNLKIQAVKFHKTSSFTTSDFFHQEIILHKLTGNDIEYNLEKINSKDIKQVIREKEKNDKSKTKSITVQPGILEVDLHINALIDSVTGLSNADILEYQLSKFHEILRENQGNRGKKIVFIHGIGNGTLKQKIHSELKSKCRKYYQQDASFKEYGWGATMVTIR